MNKKKSIILSIIAIISICTMSTTTAFAAGNYVNSTGSETGDIAILENPSYEVKGQDISQNKKSEYESIEYADEKITSKCDVYATIKEGSDIYDPDNPNANEDGFVDGSIVVSVPTVIIIDGTPNEQGQYIGKGNGKVKGNISGTTIINVVAEEQVVLKQLGKDDIIANILQTYKKFAIPTSTATGADLLKTVSPSFTDECKFEITVITDKASAGSWSGSYNNNIFLTTV